MVWYLFIPSFRIFIIGKREALEIEEPVLVVGNDVSLLLKVSSMPSVSFG